MGVGRKGRQWEGGGEGDIPPVQKATPTSIDDILAILPYGNVVAASNSCWRKRFHDSVWRTEAGDVLCESDIHMVGILNCSLDF